MIPVLPPGFAAVEVLRGRVRVPSSVCGGRTFAGSPYRFLSGKYGGKREKHGARAS
jgi:hypothetical protein